MDHKNGVSQRKVASKFEYSTRTVGRMLKSLKNQSDDQENKKAKENNFAKGLCSTKMPFHVHEVLKKGVVSFINKYHSRDQYIDLHCDIKSTSSHYANSVQDWLGEQSISFLAKKDNPANLPEVRPIEDLFAIIKRDVYRNGWSANNIEQLEQRISRTLKRLPIFTVQKLIKSTIRRIDHVRRKRIQYFFKLKSYSPYLLYIVILFFYKRLIYRYL